jgi:hypothetical protein
MIVQSEKIPAFLAELRETRFFGQVMLQFRDGEITLIERKETILTDKPKTQRGTRVRDIDNSR